MLWDLHFPGEVLRFMYCFSEFGNPVRAVVGSDFSRFWGVLRGEGRVGGNYQRLVRSAHPTTFWREDFENRFEVILNSMEGDAVRFPEHIGA